MSGYRREEAIGKSWQDLTPKEFHPSSKKAVKDIEATGKAIPYVEQ